MGRAVSLRPVFPTVDLFPGMPTRRCACGAPESHYLAGEQHGPRGCYVLDDAGRALVVRGPVEPEQGNLFS